jgi:hypothetical protein
MVHARNHIALPLLFKPFLLAFQDPADPRNDLGRPSLAVLDLRETFRKLHTDLCADLQSPTRKKHPTALLFQFVGRCDGFYDDMRVPVELWGAQFVKEDAVSADHEVSDHEASEMIQEEMYQQWSAAEAESVQKIVGSEEGQGVDEAEETLHVAEAEETLHVAETEETLHVAEPETTRKSIEESTQKDTM